jgi:hypothetical protein
VPWWQAMGEGVRRWGGCEPWCGDVYAGALLLAPLGLHLGRAHHQAQVARLVVARQTDLVPAAARVGSHGV